ncbi:MAG: GSCFA domain-containing protein [Pseudomonadota bacterium]|nr:GSCFA domain-containing protein [Pseudomonadota bacterium]
MANHPYASAPPHRFWRDAVAAPAYHDVDPVVAAKFTISAADKVATAGSCFAQHIARHLANSGFHYLVTETPHPLVRSADTGRFGYGVFTARYGNVYTTRQLLQLLQRAYGVFVAREAPWRTREGRYLDPFRPRIQPGGFFSLDELDADRAHHFACVRQAIETMDVLVFTLGLTETWVARADGAAFPLCPGVAGGEFDESRYAFVNLSVAEVVADLEAVLQFVRTKNPAAKVMLTVSPVPLVATATDRNVLTATAYSKAVLRVAAEEIANAHPHVAYFPSFEVITGNHARGRYFDETLREVTPEGVAHVMRLFMRHYARKDSAPAPRADEGARYDAATRAMEREAALVCEEMALDARNA